MSGGWGKSTAAAELPSVAEALALVHARVAALPPESIALAAALGLVLGEDVQADIDAPPFAKSLVDGYAVRSRDVADSGQVLRVGESIAAGQVPSRALAAGEAAVIMTGAAVPDQADAIVMHERTRVVAGGIEINDAKLKPGQNILPRGREAHAGDVVLARGCVLTPARLGVAASFGRTELRAIRRPKVAIAPTGDELVPPTQIPGPGQIRDSSSTTLAALAAQAGAVAETLGIVADDPGALRAAFAKGLESDLLVISGGVSAGKHDLVPETLEALGVACVFHKVRIKPGKPIWFGVKPRTDGRTPALVFGLPGNPVGSLVGFLVFVRAAIDGLLGRGRDRGRPLPVRLARDFAHKGDRPTYHPATLQEDALEPVAAAVDWAGSADLSRAAAADGFLLFEAGDRLYKAGEIVGFLPMR